MSFNMPRDTSNVTDRSAERERRRQARTEEMSYHDVVADVSSDEDMGAAGESANVRQRDTLNSQFNAMREDFKIVLERRDAQIFDLSAQFGKANTRISILTAALMESLHGQWRSLTDERDAAEARHRQKLDKLSEQINVIRGLVGGDGNEYAQARLDELNRKIHQ